MIISFIIILLVLYISSYFIKKGVNTSWYKCIEPSITPPKWMFKFIWSFFYIVLYFAFIHVLQTKNLFLISIISLHFILQIVWSYYFFDKKRVDIAFIFMQMLILTVLILISFSKDNYTKYLLFPYLGWLFYAASLNTAALSSEYINNCKQLKET